MYVDFHSHILPGADHGSDDIEMSLEQLKNAHAAGIDTIVATPHFYLDSDTVDEFLARRDKAYAELEAVNDFGIKIIKGAEVRLSTNIEKLEDIERLCIEGTNYILIEFPPEPWPYWIYDAVTEIARGKRLRPICAHIDRYSPLGREKILRLNIDVQMNASALLLSRRHRNYYLDLIIDDAVHLLGSDSHRDGLLAYKDFAAAAKKAKKLMDPLTTNARRILASGQKRIHPAGK